MWEESEARKKDALRMRAVLHGGPFKEDFAPIGGDRTAIYEVWNLCVLALPPPHPLSCQCSCIWLIR